jgi:hypothetical protein
MGVLFRLSFFSLVTAFVAVSCNAAEATLPLADLSTATPVSFVADGTPTLAGVPKQNDLIFIEFFAGT